MSWDNREWQKQGADGRSKTSRYRENVRVLALIDTKGKITPIRMELHDGTSCRIDKVMGMKPEGERKDRGTGDRYTIVVQGRESYLYFERSMNLTGSRLGQWYIEAEMY